MTASVPLREKNRYQVLGVRCELEVASAKFGFFADTWHLIPDTLSFAPPFSKELLHRHCAIGSQNAALDLDPVIQLAMIQHAQSRAARSRLGIARAEHQPPESRACTMAPAHMAQGSIVTYRSQPSSR